MESVTREIFAISVLFSSLPQTEHADISTPAFDSVAGVFVVLAVCFSKTAFTRTVSSGIMNLLSLISISPLMTCHSLKWQSSDADAVSVTFSPALFLTEETDAVPPLALSMMTGC